MLSAPTDQRRPNGSASFPVWLLSLPSPTRTDLSLILAVHLQVRMEERVLEHDLGPATTTTGGMCAVGYERTRGVDQAGGENRTAERRRRTVCHWHCSAAWAIAFVSTLGALFVGEVMGQTPCNHCWHQRAFMFPLAVMLNISAFRGTRASGAMPCLLRQ